MTKPQLRELIREVIKETGYYSGVPGVGKEHNDTIRFTQSFNGDELKNYLEKRYGKDSLRAKANFSAWLLLTDDGKKFLEANKNTLDRDYIDNSQKILNFLMKKSFITKFMNPSIMIQIKMRPKIKSLWPFPREERHFFGFIKEMFIP